MTSRRRKPEANDENTVPLRSHSAPEIEELVLGALLMDDQGIDAVISILSAKMFHIPVHQKMFAKIVEREGKGLGSDMFAIADELVDDLRDKGGVSYILNMTMKVSSANKIVEHALILKQKYIERESIKNFSLYVAKLADGEDVVEVLEEANKFMDATTEIISGTHGGMEHISTISDRAMTEANQRAAMFDRGESPYVTTGLRDLDRKVIGWKGGDMVIVAGRPGSGKALSLDELILTDQGWVQNKDLKIGDKVASIDGAESRVTGIYPLGEVDFYKIKFSDGREVDCCGDHLWEVFSHKFSNNPVRVMNTKQIQEKLTRTRYKRRMSIPMFSGNYGIEKHFIVHPYVLGVLLGDGCLTRGLLYSKNDLEINAEIEKHIDGHVFVSSDRGHANSNKININGGNKEYIQELKRLGVWGKRSWEKFIPDEYFHASREQRLALLSGLLDTDGDVCKNGSVSFSSASLQLAQDVQQLAWSLGYKCTIGDKQGRIDGVDKRMSYRLYIANGETESELFTLPRKKDRLKTNRKTKPLVILSVDYIGKKEGQCISVSHPRALYITKDYLVTHNTSVMLHMIISVAKKGVPVCVYSLEMSDVSLVNRLLVGMAGISYDDFKRGNLDSRDWTNLERANSEIQKLPIYIDGNPVVNMRYIRAHSKMMKKKGKCGAIFLDYLQLADMGLEKDNRTREQEVSQTSRQIKVLAKELDVPIIVLSQLSRRVEERADKMPILSDLRESGSLEQDADSVVFIYRPEYYKVEMIETSSFGHIPSKGIGMLNVAKQRDGSTGVVLFGYNESMTNIFDYENKHSAPVVDRNTDIGRVHADTQIQWDSDSSD